MTIAIVLAIAAAAVLAAPASALLVHPFLKEFGSDGTSATNWSGEGPARLTVDQLSHDVFVSRELAGIDGRGIIYRFDSDGAPHPFTAGEKAGTNRLPTLHIYPDFRSYKHTPSLTIAPPGAIGNTAGDIYVVDQPPEGPGTLEIFSPDGAHIGSIDGSGNPNTEVTRRLHGVATDPSGNIYLSYQSVTEGQTESHTDKYVPSGNPVTNADFDSESGFSLGSKVFVDPISEDFYTTTIVSAFPNGEVRQFDKEGNLLSTITVPNEAWGVAADHVSGRVYISNTDIFEHAGRIRIYGPGVDVGAPTAKIDPIMSYDFKSAHFTGAVNAGGEGEGQKTNYRFHCVPACPGLQGNREIPADGQDHEVADDTVGLEPETVYEVTLIAENQVAKDEVAVSFETPAKPPAEAPEVTIDPVGTHTATTAHLSGGVNPRGEGELQETSYRFEYSADGVLWNAAPDQGPITGEGFQEVSTDLSSLQPNTTYSVRLRAENVGGAVTSAAPNPSFTTDPAPPEVEITGATRVHASTAQLNGRVLAGNSATTYYFQWGAADCASSVCASLPLSEAGDAGSAGSPVWVAEQLGSLAPASTYHYRLVAENSGGKAISASATFDTSDAGACSNQAQRLGASANLPDCRAYEMVSPLEKDGGEVAANPERTRSAEDGDAVSYASQTGFAGAPGVADAGAEYISTRGPMGWVTHPLTPPQAASAFPHVFTGSAYVGGLSADLSTGVFQGLAPITGVTTPNVEGVSNLYLATGMRAGFPSFTLLSDAAELVPPVAFSVGSRIRFTAASTDFSHVLFETVDKRTTDAGGGHNLYEAVDGNLRLAGILPDSACGSPPCPAPESSVGAMTDSGEGFEVGTYSELAHPISDDGSRVFFVAATKLELWRDAGHAAEGFAGSLYLRENGTHTVQIDASERSTPDPKGPGRSVFQIATPDGSIAYFLSREALVDADTDGEGISLYRYAVDSPAGEHLTLMPTAGVIPLYVVGTSEDGTFVYFLSNQDDLYLLHGGEARLIADRDSGDANLGEDGLFSQQGSNAARVSPDGRHILFASRANLTGYDPHSPEPGNDIEECFLGSCHELYIYSYDSDELTCASCDPSGAPPSFYATFTIQRNAGITGFAGSGYTNTPFSSDGRFTFFTTRDGLTIADTNGKLDAYVYDNERDEIRLLSTGQCNCDSVFTTASQDGRDAFFTTREPLVRADADDLVDLYDARIGGGIDSQNAIPPAECQGDACQPPPASPNDPTPASSAFQGAGNLKELRTTRRCRKGKVRRRGRCISKRERRHRNKQRLRDTNRGGAR